MSRTTCIKLVLLCHFISAFVALGLPPFFGLILSRSLHSDATSLSGIAYVLPTLFAALASPLWGAAADRFGKKRLLVRAQLGLAISFLMAGFAPNSTVFVTALALQGLLGGTFAASRAYLGSIISGHELTESLTLMEASPRLALVTAPMLLGLFMGVESPILLYRFLAALPLLAALLALKLPSDNLAGPRTLKRHPGDAAVAPVSQRLRIPLVQFTLGFSAVLISPYFISDTLARFPYLGTSAVGFLFGLPHLVYLFLARPLSRGLAKPERHLAPTLAALGLSIFAQGAASSMPAFVFCRAATGVAMTAAFIELHALISSTVRPGREGRLFGWLETLAKFSAVAGGFAASLIVRELGTRALFSASALSIALVLAALWALGVELPAIRRQEAA